VTLANGETTTVRDSASFRGYTGAREAPSSFLLMHHRLHVEILIDRHHPVGSADPAGIADILLESAVTTIQDCEDSVAAVDARDKVRVYRNWLGLMQGTLRSRFAKNGKELERTLNADRRIFTATGVEITLQGRSLMLVRHVGPHVLSDAVLFRGVPIPETILDAGVTALIAMHDLTSPRNCHNSRRGSIYMVKPKLHGSAEVALADELFGRVEDMLGLERYALKMGVMDEERRTSLNLSQCIHAARHRLIFINTGFLDRTGDEIHTSMEAGAVTRRADLRKADWLSAYEQQNVELGIRHGLPGKAQIGKGMWTMPDRMAAMMSVKLDHPQSGATTAWVPTPAAATLHTLHYHNVDVHRRQWELAQISTAVRRADLLRLPLAEASTWATPEVERDIDSYTQSILGYVVRWIDFGIGCSKVPDIHHVGLMEDRATLRIASQHLANWLHHGICTHEQVEDSLLRMVHVVDRQNSGDPTYSPMAVNLGHNIAFAAARELIFLGRDQPNGYTEAILYKHRRQRKAAAAGSSRG
jgi:malate synthase